MSKNPLTSLARLKLSLQLFHSHTCTHIHGAHAHLYRMSYHSNRGGGFHRGRRGGNNWGRGRSQERNYSDNAGDDGGRSYSGRPRGLRGREIGMFYARRSQAKKKHEEEQQKPVLQMDRTTERRIRNLLEDINNSENVPAQPVQSGASLSDNGDNTARPKTAPPSSTMKGACYMDMDMPSSSATEDPDNGHTTSTCSLQDYNQELDSNGELITSTQVNDYDVTTYESEKREQLSVMNELLFKDLKQKTENSKYQKMLHFRKKLPSYNMRQEIVDTINSNQVVVISGETGCGKTTQVPQFILDDFISKGQGSLCRVVCTQPRRISAVSVAERVADERNEPCGNSSVGYSIRLERKLPKPHGSILFCTTGILLKYLESDRNLLRATHIVIDEIHERDLMSDFLMIVLKDLLPVRPDLKVVLMSATLNAEQFSKYFNDCPMLNIPGFTYPVQEYYLENVLEMLRYDPPEKKQRKKKFHGRKWRENRKKELEEEEELYTWSQTLRGKFSEQTIESLLNMDEELIDIDLMYSLIQHICFNPETGAILVFVPGWKEIGDLHKLLMKDSMFSSSKFRIIPLHSMMPTVNQREVFDRPPEGVRKIVIATNIAETSITIDDVVFVIDCGKIKVKDFQPDVNLATLEAQWVSQANARQRRGRAGRVQPGHCFHLYSSYRDQKLRDYLPPEILRTRLEELCLQIKLLKFGKIEPFVGKAMQPPSFEALHQAITTLQNLEALDEEENLLPLGYHLARMPAVDPHSGKMILFGAMFGCLDPICTVAASLSFKDAFVIPLGKEAIADERRRKLANGTLSDHLMLINAFKGWERAKSRGTQSQYCWDNFLSQNVLHMLHQMKGQYADLLKDLGFIQSRKIHDDTANINSENENLIKAIIVAGLYPNVAKIAKLPNPRSKFPKPVKLQLKNDIGKVAIHPKSVNSKEKHFQSKWLIFHKLMKTNGVYVFDCSVVSPYPLLFFGGKIGNSISIVNGQRKNLVTIDDWISFYASDSITNIVKDLKQQLNGILETKIQNPCPTNWKGSNKEGAIMRAIIDLITTEEIVQLQHYDYDDD